MATTASLPAVGTKAVHKDDHAQQKGPVWRVSQVDPSREKPIRLDHDQHRLNHGLEPETRRVTGEEFSKDYQQL